jgi:hypothetical protein
MFSGFQIPVHRTITTLIATNYFSYLLPYSKLNSTSSQSQNIICTLNILMRLEVLLWISWQYEKKIKKNLFLRWVLLKILFRNKWRHNRSCYRSWQITNTFSRSNNCRWYMTRPRICIFMINLTTITDIISYACEMQN